MAEAVKTWSYRAVQKLIKAGDEDGLREALGERLSANLSNQNGWSLLMLAAVEGRAGLGELLLEKRARIDEQNHDGETALSIAAGRAHVEFMTMLLAHGAARDCQPHGKTLEEWLTHMSGLKKEPLAAVLHVLQST